jgi:thiol-disulfide isomerase/thioredoxin
MSAACAPVAFVWSELMRRNAVKRFGVGSALLACLGVCLSGNLLNSGEKPGQKVELRIVKHTELVKAIASHKGKVVLVDFWGLFCPPCKEKFPKIVALHDKHRDKGLVCISVCFDDVKKQDKALEFLKENKAMFANYLVQDPDSCQDHWDFVALPTYLVFSRDGKLVNKFTIDPDAKAQFTIDQVQKAVEKALK